MWSRLLEAFGLRRGYGERPEAELVRRAFASRFPDLEATDVRLRSREADRDVVAVIYRERDPRIVRVGTPLYKLFAVRRPDLEIEELPFDPSSPYAIRGVK